MSSALQRISGCPAAPSHKRGTGLIHKKKGNKEQLCDVAMACHSTVSHAQTPMPLMVRVLNAITREDYTFDETMKCMDRLRTLALRFPFATDIPQRMNGRRKGF